ncbi:MAG: single-stranded-DNA-specific exonuclease RecJ [Rhodospirillaceae bacterium]|jgi:single-stranded-DNA-specific exonuclease|nr:single-stranded-DNA-specific exonuclease RecJ [Rhodospirillaceae bacterium]
MSETQSAFLDVERSSTGKRWRLRGDDERLGLALSQRFGLPEILGRIMAGRGVGLEDAEAFLNPNLRTQMPDPAHLNDMDRAVARVVQAIRQNEAIAVFGDYDVDGATSSALLDRFFKAVGSDIAVYIPDRLKEGYGPNATALRKLAENGAKVVITVDCGITAFDALEAGAQAGLDVIVVDHHVAEPRLPRAHAVINPNRLDDNSPHGQMAAVGVTFLLVAAVNRALRECGWYEKRAEPDLRQWLDLVALGTVCDVALLTGINRVFVTQGGKVMAGRGNPGISALADVAGIDEAPSAYHAGFVLGPRVNAGGRVGESSLGARLLASDDKDECQDIARRLDSYNKERRDIEARCLEEAIDLVESRPSDPGVVFVAAHGWHPGVIGIVASRLVERYNRPACVVAIEDGVGKGSGRSVRGVDLGAAILNARQQDLLLNGGGHPMAAGFTVSEGALEALRSFLSQWVAGTAGEGSLVPELSVDGAIQPAAATVDFLTKLDRLAPFGSGNARPRFVFPGVSIQKADVVGIHHVRCFLKGQDGARLKAIAFRAVERPLGAALLNSNGMPLHIAGHLQVDRWQGRENAQLIIEDAAPVT